MNKRFHIFITALFCAFIGGIFALSLLLPKKEFSPTENRYLAKAPTLSLSTLRDGSFMEDVADYTADHIAGRDFWVGLKARLEVLSGKRENDGVYFGTDGETLFAQFTAPGDLPDRVAPVNKLAGKVPVPVYFSLVPDKSYVWAHRLPHGAPKRDDGSMAQQAAQLLDHKVTYVDLYPAIYGDEAFYRTDHHWTTMGASQAYEALAGALTGTFAPLPGDGAVEVSDSFYGTTWSSSGAHWVKPDSIHTLVEDGQFQVTVYPKGTPEEGRLYFTENLEKKDKYSMFLGGNQPLCVIRNHSAPNGKLLVIRDSYADSLAPMLALNWQEVHLFDLRSNLNPISRYVEENGIDQVLVLYSASNFSTDRNLALMGR